MPPFHVYRRRKDSDTWHFCSNCPEWPTSNYDTHSGTTRPTYGELCNKCIARETNDNCS
jgi:hypothetical protein